MRPLLPDPTPPTTPSPRCPPAPGTGVPVTLHPGQDVHLALARPLGDLRAELAACTGRPELLRARLYVDDRHLDDHHVVGHPPLLAGAVLRTAPTPCPTPERALAAPVHLAVLTGPRAGALLPLEPGTFTLLGVRLRVRVRRRGGVRVVVRADGHPRAGHRRDQVSLTSPAGRTRAVRGCRHLPWLPWLPCPWRGRRWPCGSLLTVRGERAGDEPAPTVTVELRDRPVLAERTYQALLASLTPATGSHDVRETRAEPRAGTLVAGLVPAVVAVTLAIVLRNPLFAIMAITAPLAILGPAAARRRRGRRRRPPGPSADDGPGSWETPWGPAALRAGLPPADLLTAAAVCAALPAGALTSTALTSAVASPAAPAGAALPSAALPGAALPGDLPDGCLAVVGPPALGAALAARMIVSLHACGRGQAVTILCDPSRSAAWAWARWLPHTQIRTPATAGPLEAGTGRLLVVDCGAPGPLFARLGAWHASHPEQAPLLLVVDDAAAVPSWCAARATIEGGRVVWCAPGTVEEVTTFDGVSTDWLEAYARRVAALSQRGRWTHLLRPVGAGRTPPGADLAGRGPLPRRAALSEVPTLWEVEHHWREHAQGPARPAGDRARASETLEARIGVGQGGTEVTIDLLRDGPHALVAGTTGAGKSELLQTLVLTLALAYSPEELSVALVDYKGGASFGECARLPHVVGQVTDLDPGAAERALTGLRAELRRREQLFAGVGAGDLATYRARSAGAEPLPRLLIVVDEFRAMADDHPGFIPGLVRIAAQGRSLGVHLVLATQRPSGAISADMRANISLRVALRVAGTADSQDVIDAPDAAWIPADLPGRAVVRRGQDPPEMLQTYFAGGMATLSGPGVWHSPLGVGPQDAGLSPGARSLVGRPGEPPATDETRDPVAALVSRAVQVAAASGIGRPRVPWTPALPTRVRWDDLDDLDTAGSPASTLLLGLADHPQDQHQRPFGWAPAEGHLLVLGRAGSGRTTALRTLAHAALASGCVVHLVGPTALTAGLDTGDPRLGSLGTVASRADPRRVARLLTVLMAGAGGEAPGARGPVAHVVVVDGLEDVLQAMSTLHRGAGLDLFLSALREGPSRGLTFALSGTGAPTSGVGALIRHRMVLSGGDKHEDTFLGIPAALAGLGGPPGRAVLLSGPTPVLCQVAVVETGVAGVAGVAVTGPRLTGPALTARRTRIEEVPYRVHAAGAVAPGPGMVLLGRGGDDAGPLWVRSGESFLVCGPHGSGRTTVLGRFLETSPRTGDPGLGAGTGTGTGTAIVGVVSRDGLLTARARALGEVPVLTRLTPAAAGRFVDDVRARRAMLAGRHPAPALRLVVDDLDAFALSCPAALEDLCALADGGAEDGGCVALVASATTVAAAGAFRGALADLRAARYGVVLTPGVPGSSEVFGSDLGWQVEPEVHRPGRGVLVDGSSSTFVQVLDA